MKILIFLLLFPTLLFAQKYSFLIDGVRNGNKPGLVIAVFTEQPKTVLDTIGWQAVSATENEPITRTILRGRVMESDSLGDPVIFEKDFQVNWSLADTVFNLPVTLPDSIGIKRVKLIAGQLRPASAIVTDSVIAADSTWRVER